MRPLKPLCILFVTTLVALAYVNLQVEQIKVGYRIKKKEEIYGRLLDQNKILRYNNLALKSPARMEKLLLARKINMEMPSRISFLVLEKKQSNTVLASALDKGKSFILGFFTVKHEAYAKTDR